MCVPFLFNVAFVFACLYLQFVHIIDDALVCFLWAHNDSFFFFLFCKKGEGLVVAATNKRGSKYQWHGLKYTIREKRRMGLFFSCLVESVRFFFDTRGKGRSGVGQTAQTPSSTEGRKVYRINDDEILSSPTSSFSSKVRHLGESCWVNKGKGSAKGEEGARRGRKDEWGWMGGWLNQQERAFPIGSTLIPL